MNWSRLKSPAFITAVVILALGAGGMKAAIDTYRVYLRKGQRLKLSLNGPAGATSNLLLWKPGTKRVNDLRTQNLRAAQAIGPGSSHRLGYRVPKKGWYYVEVKVTTRGSGPYELTITRSK